MRIDPFRSNAHKRERPAKPTRRGYTLLEVQVAFVMLGIGLAGVCPIVVMQVRLSQKVAAGFDPQTSYFGSGQTYYLFPSVNSWARKLGVSATVQTTPGTFPTGSTSAPAYAVTVVTAPEANASGDTVTVTVQVTPQTH